MPAAAPLLLCLLRAASAAEPPQPDVEGHPCTVPRRTACAGGWLGGMLGGGDPDCLSASEFRRSYLRQQAVLISGLTGGWAALEKWQPADLARHYGEVPVRLTDPQNYAYEGGINGEPNA